MAIGAESLTEIAGYHEISNGDSIPEKRRYFFVGRQRVGNHFETAEDIAFSPNGTQVALVVRRGKARFVAVDDRRLGEADRLDNILQVTFSPDGREVAFYATRDGQNFIYLENRVISESSSIPHGGIVFSPTGRELAYRAALEPPTTLTGAELAKRNPAFAALGKVKPAKTWTVSGMERTAIVVWRRDGTTRRLGEELDRAWSLVYSPDGRSSTVQGKRGDKDFLLMDGKPVGADYSSAVRLIYAPQGRGFAFVGYRDRTALLVRGETETALDGLTGYTEIVFSPDGKRLALSERAPGTGDRVSQVFPSRLNSDAYDRVACLRFSSDGRSLRFAARRGPELWWKVLALPEDRLP